MGKDRAIPGWMENYKELGLDRRDVPAIWEQFGEPQRVWKLTEEDHPELMKRLSEACHKAKVPMPAILVAEDNWMPSGLYLYSSNTMVIPSKLIDKEMLPDCMYIVGHESGHKYSRRQFSVQLATVVGFAVVPALELGTAVAKSPKKPIHHDLDSSQESTHHAPHTRKQRTVEDKLMLAGLAAIIPVTIALRSICTRHNELDADNYAIRYFCNVGEAKAANLRTQKILDDKMDEVAGRGGFKAGQVKAFRAMVWLQNALHLPMYPTTKQRLDNLNKQDKTKDLNAG